MPVPLHISHVYGVPLFSEKPLPRQKGHFCSDWTGARLSSAARVRLSNFFIMRDMRAIGALCRFTSICNSSSSTHRNISSIRFTFQRAELKRYLRSPIRADQAPRTLGERSVSPNGWRYRQEPHASRFIKSLCWLLSSARDVRRAYDCKTDCGLINKLHVRTIAPRIAITIPIGKWAKHFANLLA